MAEINLKIRMATTADAEALLSIYAPYVKNTAISYEYDVPTLGEFTRRINKTLKTYPYLVAEYQDEIVGYAYASRLHERKAYDWAVETSIYVRQDLRGLHIGKRLYDVLEEILKLQNVLNLNACIAYPEAEDEYLTRNSVQFHEHLGYRMIGRFHQCAYKFGRWYDMVWMEKSMGEHPAVPLDFIVLPELPHQSLSSCFL